DYYCSSYADTTTWLF
nr:immunoglobulin light chain junction region [Macaca mulatta]MOV72591.1 immunoglobulin light chain junction region [Macaca mulatta]MOV72732.1 immunoglobulin light chain junction region [Macaca mulatta]MOV72835.1 immunoglobulin light chain junction region [Macaca mulatta]MOV73244.1 immunoglobulin light chain junction region [Macaca mulatta]